MSVSSMKLVGLQFHQSGGNRQFKKAQFCRANQRMCYPDLNLADGGTVNYATYLSSGSATGRGIAVDPNTDNAYVTGGAGSAYPTSTGVFQTAFGGGTS